MSSFKDLIKKDNQIVFKIRDVDVSLLNSIRRVLLSEIPNIAFEFEPYNINNPRINIITNTCPLHNEIILQRLSMIPLNFDVNDVLDFDDSKYNFIINKKNNTNKILDVTTEDIAILNENNKPYPDKFIRKIFPKNNYSDDFILLTKLKPNLINKDDGNSIHIEMIASKDIAQNYSGYSYVSQCVYSNIVNDNIADKELKNRIKKFKKENSENTQEDIESFIKDFNNLDRARFFHKNKYDEPNFFEFSIESEYRTEPEYLFFKSLTIINDKINNLIKNITENTFEFLKVENSIDLYDIIIKNEKHTLGNLIQSLFYNIFIRKGEKKIIEYVGYNCPHPLENYMIIRIKLNKEQNPGNINKIFIDGLEDIQELLRKLNKEWIKFTKLTNKYSNDITEF